MPLLTSPPQGVTLTETLTHVEITLPPPSAEAPRLAKTLSVGGVGLITVGAWQLYAHHEIAFALASSFLQWLVASAQEELIQEIAAALLREPILIWLFLGVGLFYLFAQAISLAQQSSSALAAILTNLLKPPQPVSVTLSPHQVTISGQQTLLHEVTDLAQVRGLSEVLAKQPEPIRAWMMARLHVAISERPPGSASEVPEGLRRMRVDQPVTG